MISGSVDTNVLVRLVAQDDPLQAQAVDRLFARHAKKSEMLMVPITVVLELEWVLRGYCKSPPEDVLTVLTHLLAMPI